MDRSNIGFNVPYLSANALDYVRQAVKNRWLAGGGEFTKKCHLFLEQTLGVPKVLLTTSCTDALEMSALLLDLKPGDEVILPSFTFVSTANAFVLRGAKPVFIDIRPDTLNLDERQLEAKISPRTKAIVPVHYGGVGCEMNAIMEIAEKHRIAVVEDNAHGLFGKYRGRNLGTFGSFATQSFHETKNFSCGEGGALLINDPRQVERAEILREKGTNRSRFLRGQVDKYTWVDVGSSFLPSDILAALLYAQFEERENIQQRRQHIWELYHAGLKEWASQNTVQLPFVPEHCDQSYHLFYLLMPSLQERQGMIEYLKGRGIYAMFHYVPLHSSPMGLQCGSKPGDCPTTERVSECLVRLPFHNDLSNEEVGRVVSAVREFPGLKKRGLKLAA